jgi:hypothetical protein
MLNEIKEPIMYVYRALYPVVWFSILLFCLGQVKLKFLNHTFILLFLNVLGSTSNVQR